MKVKLLLEVYDDVFVERMIDLPFPPQDGMSLTFAHSDDDTTILDQIIIESSEYYLTDEAWECFVGMHFGVFQDTPELLPGLLDRGWYKAK